MPAFLLRLIGLGILVLAGNELFKSNKKFKITSKSNCDESFRRFNQSITIHSDKVAKLRRAHNTIRKRISEYFYNYTNYPIPDFYIQGSYKTKTIIENTDSLCDVDLGVFFPCNPGVHVETLQKHIKKALDGHTSKGVEIITNCVRLNYVKDFHVDLPIYYTDSFWGKTYFGRRGHRWERSEPKEFVNWFKEVTYRKPQLVRIIRYLKAWANNTKIKTGKKLPSGLALTIWAIKFYEGSKRDDVAFFKTCTGILKYLDDYYKSSWSAEMPVEPYDNILDRLNNFQKSLFYDEFKIMVSISADAVSSLKKYDAIRFWKQVFGYRFK